jgi:hypothetical protein
MLPASFAVILRRLPRLFAPFKHGELILKSSNHFADASLGETLRPGRIRLSQWIEPILKQSQLFLRLFEF